MPGIKIRENESFDEAYRRFKKQADRNLVVTESRARRFFESQTEKRKKQKNNSCGRYKRQGVSMCVYEFRADQGGDKYRPFYIAASCAYRGTHQNKRSYGQ